jgi:hypothetical protein
VLFKRFADIDRLRHRDRKLRDVDTICRVVKRSTDLRRHNLEDIRPRSASGRGPPQERDGHPVFPDTSTARPSSAAGRAPQRPHPGGQKRPRRAQRRGQRRGPSALACASFYLEWACVGPATGSCSWTPRAWSTRAHRGNNALLGPLRGKDEAGAARRGDGGRRRSSWACSAKGLVTPDMSLDVQGPSSRAGQPARIQLPRWRRRRGRTRSWPPGPQRLPQPGTTSWAAPSSSAGAR